MHLFRTEALVKAFDSLNALDLDWTPLRFLIKWDTIIRIGNSKVLLLTLFGPISMTAAMTMVAATKRRLLLFEWSVFRVISRLCHNVRWLIRDGSWVFDLNRCSHPLTWDHILVGRKCHRFFALIKFMNGDVDHYPFHATYPIRCQISFVYLTIVAAISSAEPLVRLGVYCCPSVAVAVILLLLCLSLLILFVFPFTFVNASNAR